MTEPKEKPKEKQTELEKANEKAVRTGTWRDFHNWMRLWRNR